MTRAAIIACWIAVVLAGGFLRFDELASRPFHADEATGARLAALRMGSGDYHFDPTHFHGPTMGYLAIPMFRGYGENDWAEMTKTPPRLLVAMAGTLVLLIPLAWRRRFGDGPTLFAAALLATSPLLVYYSRMFIHESLLVLFGMLVLLSCARAPRWGIPGIFIGLMFATKESFAISMIAWMAAATLVLIEQRQALSRAWWVNAWQSYGKSIGLSILTAAFVSGYFYTDGFRHPTGALNAVRTFFEYKTVGGHEKSIGYYFELLVLPFKSGGIWWYGTPVVFVALLGFVASFQRDANCPRAIRFLAYATLGHFFIYSVIAYKTPWLACLPWAHACLLGGLSLVGFSHKNKWLKIALGLLVVFCLATQWTQARFATGRFASDERNPFAYVPTRSDLEDLSPWLKKLGQTAPDTTLEPVAVIGTDYWPLPWYLRAFKRVGYWGNSPSNLMEFPLVFAMPEVEDAVSNQLKTTHTALPRGLRAGVSITLFVKNEVWNRWMKSAND